MQRCVNCGHLNRAGIVFCENCGASLIGKMPLDTKSLDSSNDDEQAQIGVDSSVIKDVQVQGIAEFVEGASLRLDIEGSPDPILFKPKSETIFGRRDPATGAMPDIDLTPFAGYRMGVSRRHAAIRFGESHILDLWDLGSSNGTFLNGDRLNAHRPYRLHDGDEIRLGEMMIRVYFQPPGPSTSEPKADKQASVPPSQSNIVPTVNDVETAKPAGEQAVLQRPPGKQTDQLPAEPAKPATGALADAAPQAPQAPQAPAAPTGKPADKAVPARPADAAPTVSPAKPVDAAKTEEAAAKDSLPEVVHLPPPAAPEKPAAEPSSPAKAAPSGSAPVEDGTATVEKPDAAPGAKQPPAAAQAAPKPDERPAAPENLVPPANKPDTGKLPELAADAPPPADKPGTPPSPPDAPPPARANTDDNADDAAPDKKPEADSDPEPDNKQRD